MPSLLAQEAPRRSSGVSESSDCYLAIMRRADSEILVSEDRGRYRLPVLEIPKKQRAAPHLLPAIQRRFGLQTVCRFSVATSQIEPGGRCVVLDVRNPDASLSGEEFWLPVREIRWDEFEPPVRDALWEVFAKINAYATGRLSAKFVSPGWLDEVAVWTQSHLLSRGLELAGLSSQFNMGPDFALLRFETSGSGVWFKAVGHPNLREFDITARLAEFELPHVPEVIGTHEDWRAWLMREATGSALGEGGEPTEWETTARSLAELQLASITHVTPLLAAGCIDLRTTSLHDVIEPWLSGIALLMDSQPEQPPRRLAIEDLRLIERHLRAACRQIQALSFPETLGHSDFNSGNVLVAGEQAVFLDWAQAHIGSPFLTLEYLLLLLRRAFPDNVERLNAVREEYLRLWRPVCSARQLARALEIAPLLAAFAYAVVCDRSQQEVPAFRTEFAGYFRSLARRIYAEAERLEQLSVPAGA